MLIFISGVAKEEASSKKKNEENILQVAPQARTHAIWTTELKIDSLSCYMLIENHLSATNDRLQESAAPLND